MANVDIHAVVSTIENYENRTLTPISVSNNSVQSTVTNNSSAQSMVTNNNCVQSTVTNNHNSVQQTVIDLVPMTPNPQNNTIPILKYPRECDNKCLWHK